MFLICSHHSWVKWVKAIKVYLLSPFSSVFGLHQVPRERSLFAIHPMRIARLAQKSFLTLLPGYAAHHGNISNNLVVTKLDICFKESCGYFHPFLWRPKLLLDNLRLSYERSQALFKPKHTINVMLANIYSGDWVVGSELWWP